MSNGYAVLSTCPAACQSKDPSKAVWVRRCIDPQSGRALEILGHAIEYLMDEYALDSMSNDGDSSSYADGRMKAIQLLMATNRQIYFECPVVEDLKTRCLNILHKFAS